MFHRVTGDEYVTCFQCGSMWSDSVYYEKDEETGEITNSVSWDIGHCNGSEGVHVPECECPCCAYGECPHEQQCFPIDEERAKEEAKAVADWYDTEPCYQPMPRPERHKLRHLYFDKAVHRELRAALDYELSPPLLNSDKSTFHPMVINLLNFDAARQKENA
ncbi:hypothetical protein [Streptomyces sp. PA5.6]|uniref:hypothetical protein n=1 Tax=Streptomyces sp. PA5.6 TaxID=3035651 RepID=UPI003904D566